VDRGEEEETATRWRVIVGGDGARKVAESENPSELLDIIYGLPGPAVRVECVTVRASNVAELARAAGVPVSNRAERRRQESSRKD